MKKRSLKFGLTKSKVSNLTRLIAINGGDLTYSEENTCIESVTFAIDLCCDANRGL
ncbi:hypothetical protein [Kordia sp.]|uniref:hypothetical protein n=1 Tax=Kordia sp. TaxID=1965332 RepID=UPI0025BE181F|nr:hypothetical protein [Kordia sp.]MCH2195239.1 hypothetical protein [Kordia sp.]